MIRTNLLRFMQMLTRGKIISVLLEDCEIGSLRIESLIPVNTKMGGPIATLFMPMSAEGSSTSL